MDYSFWEGLIIGAIIFSFLFAFLMWISIRRLAARLFGRWMNTRLVKEVNKSLEIQRPVIKGKISEEMFPIMYGKLGNLSDLRFIGSPVDYIAFEGLSEPDRNISIKFIEVKTGASKLNRSEERIKEAVQDKRISWDEIYL